MRWCPDSASTGRRAHTLDEVSTVSHAVRVRNERDAFVVEIGLRDREAVGAVRLEPDGEAATCSPGVGSVAEPFPPSLW